MASIPVCAMGWAQVVRACAAVLLCLVCVCGQVSAIVTEELAKQEKALRASTAMVEEVIAETTGAGGHPETPHSARSIETV